MHVDGDAANDIAAPPPPPPTSPPPLSHRWRMLACAAAAAAVPPAVAGAGGRSFRAMLTTRGQPGTSQLGVVGRAPQPPPPSAAPLEAALAAVAPPLPPTLLLLLCRRFLSRVAQMAHVECCCADPIAVPSAICGDAAWGRACAPLPLAACIRGPPQTSTYLSS